MEHRVLTESIELHPIGSCFSDNVGNSELREILREYFGKNEISYTADYSNELWGEVMQFLERNCKFILKSATPFPKCYLQKRNGLLIRKTAIKSSRPFHCAYHPLTP